MKYLHIMPDSIYSKDYSDRINKLYCKNEHFFLIHQWEGEREYSLSNGKVVQKVNWRVMLELIKYIIFSKKIILHSLFIDQKMHVIFALLSLFMHKKFLWYIWSADLYNEHFSEIQLKKTDFKKQIKKFMREIIIWRLEAIIVVAEGDYNAAKSWYKTRAKMIQAEYAYNLLKNGKGHRKSHKGINILAGHNAAPCCKHIEMFEHLTKHNNKDIKVFSVLTYPKDEDYIEMVIKRGKKILRDKFIPITEWMPYEEYVQFLGEIDIAVFEGNIQMGAGNIFNLLFLGKKVYLSAENSIYGQLRKEGVRCYLTTEIKNNSFFELIEENIKNENRRILEELFSDNTFKKKWDMVFT